MAAKLKPRMIGRHIVADPAVCHGQPTFRGTRILVSDVLEQVSAGMAWESIALEWREQISKEAIAEAVRLASARPSKITPANTSPRSMCSNPCVHDRSRRGCC